MPVLHRDSNKSGYFAKANLRGQMVAYQLSPEGEQFLTAVLNLRDGAEIRQADFDLLLDRGWATTGETRPVEAVPVEAVPVEVLRAVRPSPPAPPVVKPAATEPTRAEPLGPAKTRRTRAREIALQILYQVEQNPSFDGELVRKFIARRLHGDRKLCAFAEALIAGVQSHQSGIDEVIAGLAENWRLDRMAAIDRNILRLGAFEMLHCPDVPRKVAINEALELAKRYSTAQSSRFVNGILDRLHAEDSKTADESPVTLPPEDAPASPAGPEG